MLIQQLQGSGHANTRKRFYTNYTLLQYYVVLTSLCIVSLSLLPQARSSTLALLATTAVAAALVHVAVVSKLIAVDARHNHAIADMYLM
jgi:hypothetical protein